MYCTKSFPTKKALKQAVESGQKLEVFQPNDMFGNPIPQNATVSLEGPNYVMHKWYARATLKDGFIVKVS
jgi:hypothetical protein